MLSTATKSKWTKRVLIFGIALVCVFVGLCSFFRISRLKDFDAYLGMASESHPVWKQFAFRRFDVGDSATDFLRQYPPSQREEFGRFGVYHYHPSDLGDRYGVVWLTGLVVTTKDGKLLSAQAGSCTWEFTFFKTVDAEFDREYAAFVKDRHEKLEQARKP